MGGYYLESGADIAPGDESEHCGIVLDDIIFTSRVNYRPFFRHLQTVEACAFKALHYIAHSGETTSGVI